MAVPGPALADRLPVHYRAMPPVDPDGGLAQVTLVERHPLPVETLKA